MTSKGPNTSKAHGSPTHFDYGKAYGYRFGTVEVDFHGGDLYKLGMRIRIQDQPLQVLSILLRHPGEIVTREEFRALLWPADTFVDFDHGLSSAVRKLRYALDDDPEHPFLIETVPRHGYRFIASVVEMTSKPAPCRDGMLPGSRTSVEKFLPVRLVEPEAVRNPVGKNSSAMERRSSLTLFIVLTAVCILVAGLFLGIHILAARARRIPTSPPAILVVLPFRDLSSASSQGLIADGMTQALITHLGNLDSAQILVRARVPVETGEVGKKPKSGPEVGLEYVLEGSTQLQGNHLRTAVQLIRTSDQSYVWAGSYDDITYDVLQAQADIAAQITTAIRQKLIR